MSKDVEYLFIYAFYALHLFVLPFGCLLLLTACSCLLSIFNWVISFVLLICSSWIWFVLCWIWVVRSLYYNVVSSLLSTLNSVFWWRGVLNFSEAYGSDYFLIWLVIFVSCSLILFYLMVPKTFSLWYTGHFDKCGKLCIILGI